MRWPRWISKIFRRAAPPLALPAPPSGSWTPADLDVARAALAPLGLVGMLPAAAPEPSAPISKAAAPSVFGWGGFTPSAPTVPETQPAGVDGVNVYAGFVVSNERDPRLIGTRKWITFDEQVVNVAVIGAAVNVWTKLGGSAKWDVEPNPAGGPGAELGAELVREGLLEAQLSTPWNQVVRRQLMKAFRGFALHEVVLRRRADATIVVGDLLDRPQWTIYRWNRPDARAPWTGVEQQTQLTGATAPYIPRERLFYSVENTISASPEGLGFLRLTAEATRVLQLYQQWEGIGFQTDLRGVPIARAPLGSLKEQARSVGAKTDAEINAYVQAQTRFLARFLSAHDKTSEQGVMLDSATYTDLGPDKSPSGTYKWAFDLIRGSTSGMPEIGNAISRILRDIARVMCCEWLLLGGEDSGGAYSMHEDKTAMFGLVVNAALHDIADDARRDIATRIVALNGLDPETCTPRLVPEPVATGAVKDACAALAQLAAAGLAPNDPARNILRGRLDLPPEPELDAYDLALGGAPGGTERPAEDLAGEPGNPNADVGAGGAGAADGAA